MNAVKTPYEIEGVVSARAATAPLPQSIPGSPPNAVAPYVGRFVGLASVAWFALPLLSLHCDTTFEPSRMTDAESLASSQSRQPCRSVGAPRMIMVGL